MKPSHLQTLLCYSLPLLASASGCGTCIADNEAHEIAKRWLGAFASDGLPKLPEAVTENIMIYDEGANNGSTTPYVHNYTEVHEVIGASAYGGIGVTNVTYDVVFTFHTCDRIALRWQQNQYATDRVGYGSTVREGTYSAFKGTDLLTIDLESRKVMNVTTSADLLNNYRALGYDLGVWSKN